MKFNAGRCNSVLSACCLLRSGVMSLTRENKKEKVRKPRTKITWKEVKRQKVLLFWAAIMVAYGVVFYYLPLAGWAMAFQDYKPRLGIFHSAFLGYDINPSYKKYTRNGRYQSGCNFCHSHSICNLT